MVKQHLARLPLGNAGAAVCTWNQADFCSGLFLQLRRKAGCKVCPAAGNCPFHHGPVHIDWFAHLLPAAHPQHKAVRCSDGVFLCQVAAPGHVRLPHQQKRMDICCRFMQPIVDP